MKVGALPAAYFVCANVWIAAGHPWIGLFWLAFATVIYIADCREGKQ